MQRTVENLNTDWLFLPADRKGAARTDFDESKMQPVCLPHANAELPYHSFDESEYAFVSWYRRRLAVPAKARGRRIFLDFDGVMIAATIFVNGRQVAPEHKGGYTPFSHDITDFVQFGGENVVSVRVDSTERPDIPPFGHVVDYLTFGGIYRDVWLRITDPVYIEDVFARPGDALEKSKRLDVTARVVNASEQEQQVKLHMQLNDPAPGGKHWNAKRTEVTVPAGGSIDVDASLDDLRGLRLWTLDDPQLYHCVVALEEDDDRNKIGDSVDVRVGFRTAEFREDGNFYLNGEVLPIRGLNRHQTYPYIGAAAPARLQRRDAQIIKHDLACNLVRTSHYPQSPHFLDACDELGLLVFEEIPGWQHLGDAEWKEVVVQDIRDMIVRDRNRPSIILWGVRVNESDDDHDLYTRTNAVARELDPTRQTGGVRFNYDSERLEDVFTMNDFFYDLRPPNHPRYLITEFCGHMYPTKTFDQEERVRQHAWHHMHVRNQILAPDFRCAGGIAWCAFDYNTHKDFGSGDRICYHGVMDIFRQPKFAAGFSAAHADPKTKPVVEPITYWTMGDKSAAGVEPLLIATNCEEVEIVIGETSRGRFKPDREKFPHLPYPPVVATGLSAGWGAEWLPLTVHGYVGGNKVVTRQIDNDGLPDRLEATLDDEELLADGSDMTRLGLRIVDRFGNILPFQMQPVTLEVEGPATLVGENPFPMPGGRGAVYLRAGRKSGTVTVTATSGRLKPVKLKLRIAKMQKGARR